MATSTPSAARSTKRSDSRRSIVRSGWGAWKRRSRGRTRISPKVTGAETRSVPDRPRLRLPQIADHVVQLIEPIRRPRHKALARRGHAQAARGALQKPGAKLFLQFAHVFGRELRRHPEPGRSRPRRSRSRRRRRTPGCHLRGPSPTPLRTYLEKVIRHQSPFRPAGSLRILQALHRIERRSADATSRGLPQQEQTTTEKTHDRPRQPRPLCHPCPARDDRRLFLFHGLMKLFVFTPAGTAGYFQSIGLPGALGYLTMLVEIAGGIALILGIKARLVSRGAGAGPAGGGLVRPWRLRLQLVEPERRLGISADVGHRAGRPRRSGRRRLCAGPRRSRGRDHTPDRCCRAAPTPARPTLPEGDTTCS